MSLKIERRADGTATYTTTDGDVVDHVCWRYYGRDWDTTEAVLTANPGLAARGPVLLSGVVIVLPEVQAEAVTRQDSINLFD